jgi:phosphoserine phosphatase RsbU/P
MKILIAEDEMASRRLLETMLVKWGYEVQMARDGAEAWQALQVEDPPPLILLDWVMPEMDGLQVIRKIRETPRFHSIYCIILTAKDQREDILSGFEAGADDYVTKPFHREELRARLQVGARMIALQKSLADRVRQLEDALATVKQLQGLLPICSYCKRIRDDKNYWQQVESYIAMHSEVQFTHGICPSCYEKHIRKDIEDIYKINT